MLVLVLAGGLAALPAAPHTFQPDGHGFLSSHGLTLAAHLSPRHHFLMFNRLLLHPGGTLGYEAYNEFPPGAFLLLAAAMAPFEGDLAGQMAAARALMAAFFTAAAACAYLGLRRLGTERWAAASAVLLSFSSYYALYYQDMVFNDVPALFGMLLAFHGLAVFHEELRRLPLLAKVAAALALGWQAYALLVAYLLLAGVRAARRRAAAELRPFLNVAFFALGLGFAILGALLANERLTLDRPLAELPSLQRALWRLGLAGSEAYDPYRAALSAPGFLKEQSLRLGTAAVPHALAASAAAEWAREAASRALSPLVALSPAQIGSRALRLWGVAACALSLAAAARQRKRLPALSLVLAGPCWTLLVPHFTAFHEHQALYSIGVPLVLYAAAAEALPRAPLLRIAGAALAAAVFGSSALEVRSQKIGAGRGRTREFQGIARQIGPAEAVYADERDLHHLGGAHHALSFYLAGRPFASRPEDADVVLSAGPAQEVRLTRRR